MSKKADVQKVAAHIARLGGYAVTQSEGVVTAQSIKYLSGRRIKRLRQDFERSRIVAGRLNGHTLSKPEVVTPVKSSPPKKKYSFSEFVEEMSVL
jgi:hypothetical protein